MGVSRVIRQNYARRGLLFALVVGLSLTGCEATRHLTADQALIRKTPKISGARSLSEEVLLSGLRTKPNRKTLGVKLPLHLHNLGLSIATDTSFGKKLYTRLDKKRVYESELVDWLTKRVGEPPQLLDQKILLDDAQNLTSIYFGEGFLLARVQPEVKLRGLYKNKADVTFQVIEGAPFLIRQRRTVSTDPAIAALIDSLYPESLITPGSRFSEAVLTDERNKIAEALRNAGYYKFGPELISYVIDTTVAAPLTATELIRSNLRKDSAPPKWVDVEVYGPDSIARSVVAEIRVSVRAPGQTRPGGETAFRLNQLTPELQRAYHIRSRWIQSDYDMLFSTFPQLARETDMSVIARRLRIRSGQPYSLLETRRTQAQLQALGLFRNSILSYEPINGDPAKLRANLDLSLLRRWAISVGAETFQSQDFRLQSNLPGIGVSFSLLNRNLFGRAERLDLQTNGNISFYQPGTGGPLQPFYQITLRASFALPSFWLFETPRRNLLNFRPTTSFSLLLNSEQRSQFDRTTVGFDWQYQWFNIPFATRASMTLTPLSLTYVVTAKKASFQTDLLNQVNESVREFIIRDFTPRVFVKSSFYYTYAGYYGQRRTSPSWYFRAGVEYGGGGYLQDSTTNNKFVFGQFARAQAEVKYFVPLGKTTDLVARFNIGVARPVFSTRIIPYENRFFTGGTNNVRGWQSNTLGPGTYASDQPINNLIAPGGEYLLEANLEYRFKFFGALYGALFTDVGNVWFSPGANFGDTRAELTGRNFELGLASGLGLRYDFSFFIFRLDFGQQLYAPDVRRWVVQRWPRDIGGTRLIWNIGLGFPF